MAGDGMHSPSYVPLSVVRCSSGEGESSSAEEDKSSGAGEISSGDEGEGKEERQGKHSGAEGRKERWDGERCLWALRAVTACGQQAVNALHTAAERKDEEGPPEKMPTEESQALTTVQGERW